ncbi:MAG: PSD1 and planctomycete cytochrome C domain-containing protein [Planctomycetales bacterium]
MSHSHASDEAGKKLFDSQVKRILTESCLKCHGGESVKGGLDLSSRSGLLHEGDNGPAIELGKGDESRLYRLTAHLEQPHMPHKLPKLDDASIKAIKDWIDAGAPYTSDLIDKNRTTRPAGGATEKDKQFWSFKPLVRAEPPSVKPGEFHNWPRTPIDYFVQAKLESLKMHPNPLVTDRYVLIRRVYLDALGIPPTSEEISQFLNDTSTDAYEKLVDRVLASPHYGERWGRHWLDLARYAESHGYEQDYDRPTAYHYRDFVIKALNSDMPYDQFVRWQIAGDELEPDNPLALMATGFLGAGTHATQITANQVEKERYDELDDMGGTIGTAMLGLTVACARCHDHKFDPISQEDYYRFIATFTTTVRSDMEIEINRDKYRDAITHFEKDHAPLTGALENYRKNVLPERVSKWLASKPSTPKPDWLIIKPTSLKSSGGGEFVPLDDGSALVKGKNGVQDSYTITLEVGPGKITALRLETLADDSLPMGGPGRGPTGNFALSQFSASFATKAKPKEGKGLKLGKPTADFEQVGMGAAGVVDTEAATAWGIAPRTGENHALVLPLETALEITEPGTVTVSLSFTKSAQHGIGRLRISVTDAAPVPGWDGTTLTEQQLKLLAEGIQKPAGEQTQEQKKAISDWVLGQDAEGRELVRKIQEHVRKKPRKDLVTAMICSEGVPAIRLHTQGGDFLEKTYFLKRGNPNQKEGEATAGFLKVLMNSPEGEKHWQVEPPKGWKTSYRRRGLANWITDTKDGAGNLLARVIVNRMWQHHFGRGIVATPSDFGAQGERPTHPELLDWLASELIRQNWKLKPIHKLMMTSAVYQQTGKIGPTRQKLDPTVIYYWRRPLMRLEGEAIRDQMLALSGAWDQTPFGPGSLDEGQKRRSVYFTIKRSQLIPMMVLFDGPDTLQGLGQRATTTVAPQALAMLNNKQVRNYALGFAQRLLAANKTPHDTLQRAYLEALAREATPEEEQQDLAFIEIQRQQHTKTSGAMTAEELAWGDFCQALFCSNEFIYVP